PRRRQSDRDRDGGRRPRRGAAAADTARADPRCAPSCEPRGPAPFDPGRARRFPALRRVGRQARRDPETPAPRVAHRIAAGRAPGLARHVRGHPRRLPHAGGPAPRREMAVRGVFAAEEMRRLDQRAITELGIPGATLMENAGRGAAEAIVAALPALGAPRRGARVVIVCGKGGNAGDGFVVARWLKRRGAAPSVVLACTPGEVGGDARLKLEALRPTGSRPVQFEGDRALAGLLGRAHVIVDALLGTGSRGAPGGAVARAIELINASGRPVVALDIPSGMPADGGAPAGVAIRAVMTLTFAGIKRGLLAAPGNELAGRVNLIPIRVPHAP